MLASAYHKICKHQTSGRWRIPQRVSDLVWQLSHDFVCILHKVARTWSRFRAVHTDVKASGPRTPKHIRHHKKAYLLDKPVIKDASYQCLMPFRIMRHFDGAAGSLSADMHSTYTHHIATHRMNERYIRCIARGSMTNAILSQSHVQTCTQTMIVVSFADEEEWIRLHSVILCEGIIPDDIILLFSICTYIHTCINSITHWAYDQ